MFPTGMEIERAVILQTGLVDLNSLFTRAFGTLHWKVNWVSCLHDSIILRPAEFETLNDAYAAYPQDCLTDRVSIES